MSKIIGNVVNPNDIVQEYGTDALRYFAARELHPFEDSPFTMERFKESYNSGLANGLGNLVSRIMKMAEDNLEKPVEIPEQNDMSDYFALLETFDIKKVADSVWNKISELDQIIQSTEPFKLIKVEPEKGRVLISDLVVKLYSIARMLNPLMPETSSAIKDAIKNNKKPDTSLFARKD